MAKEEPLDNVIRGVQILLQQLQENAGKPIDPKNITPEVEERLTKLENAMNAYVEKLKSEAIDQDLDQRKLNEGILKMPPGLTERQQEIWVRAARTRWDAEGLRYALKKAQAAVEQPHIMEQSSTGKKRAIIKRRSKFKKMGGETWKKM